jgi:1-pyrroline-4-hydroxy-2-carboxylate deaminase
MSRPAGASIWTGVLVAMTTPFDPDGAIDLPAFRKHARWLVERGVDGLIVGGSLGEGSSLSPDERESLVSALAQDLPDGVPLIAAVAGLTTGNAVDQARRAAAAGAHGLLVLPPYVYHGDRRETIAHFSAVFRGTSLPCMLYNNPPAYGTDVTPEQVLELATDHPNFTGVKESSGDARRITAVRALLGDRVEVAVGLDDAILEGLAAGAVGWVAGLANAFPAESVALFSAGRSRNSSSATELYRWFLPLLRMDVGPKFVQQIKLVEAELGVGNPRVRLPRLELVDAERDVALATLRDCLTRRPSLSGTAQEAG